MFDLLAHFSMAPYNAAALCLVTACILQAKGAKGAELCAGRNWQPEGARSAMASRPAKPGAPSSARRSSEVMAHFMVEDDTYVLVNIEKKQWKITMCLVNQLFRLGHFE